MRTSVLFALLLVGPSAHADTALSIPVRAHLVGVILDTGQALLWDEQAGKYTLREVGEEFQGQRIIGMEKDRIQLERSTLELSHPPVVSKKSAKKMPAVIVTSHDKLTTATPPAQPAATPPPAPPAPPVAPAPPAPEAAPQPPAVPMLSEVRVSRSQVEVGLADFSALSEQVKLERAAGGGWKLVRIQDGCVLKQLGLHDGDVVRRVSDLPIETFDDAARVYARIRTWDHLTFAVERDGRPVTVVVRIAG